MSGESNDRSDAAPTRPRRLPIVARNAVFAVLGMVVVLILVALGVPLAVDLNGYKGEISARLKAMTGRDLTIAGSIDLSILPAPMVTVNDIGLGNAAGAAVPNMVEIIAVEARLALWPLLGGELLVESLTFVEPVVEFEILADGSTNWHFDTAAVGAEDSGFETRLAGLVVEDATVVYRDTRRGLIELIEDVNVEATAESLGGPFRARGLLVARGAELAFEVTMGALAERPIAVGVDLKLASVGASLSFAGSLSSASPGAELTGNLTAKGASLADIVTAFVPVGAPRPELERGFSIVGSLSGSVAGAVVDDIEFELGGIRGTGNLQAAFGDEPRIEVAMAFDSVDLDKLVAESPSAAAARDRAEDGAPFALPADLNITVDLRVDALVLNRSAMREVRIVTTLDQGILTLQQGSALLPGGADVTAFGVLDSDVGVPRFLGQVEGSADNLRAVLDWLEVPVPPIAGDRLRTMSLATELEITPKLVRFAALNVSLDDSRLSGGVSIEFRPNPTFTAIVSLDRLDLDSYLPPAVDGAPEVAKAASKGGFVAALAAIDGELKAHIGSLVYRQVPVSALVIDAAIKGGKVKLRRLTADDVADARGTISGVVDPAALAFDLAYDMETADPRRLLRVLDVTALAPVANLGPLSVRGHVKGDVAAVAFDATVAAAGAEAKLVGSVSGIATRPAVDATVTVRGAELERLVRRFGADGVADRARVGGAYSLVGKVIGDAKRAEVVFDVKAIGIQAKLNGTVTDIADGPAYDIAMTASHPDLAALAKVFFDGVELTRRGPSEIRLRARATGDAAQARVSILEAKIGPTRLNGAVEASWDGARPRLKAEIAAGEIDLDMYVPAAAKALTDAAANALSDGAAKAPPDATVSVEPSPPAERWLREPFDLSALSAVDAKVRLAADVVKVRKHRFEAVSLRLSLADGALEIDELTGRLYGAPITLTARLVDAKPPTATIAFRLDGADLRALLLDKAGGGAVSGRLDLSGKFHTKGESEFELVSALAGEAALELRDGVVQGFDLALLNRRLGALDSEAAFVRLAEAALRGGKTRVHGLQARFAVVDGVLRSDNVRAVLDGGQGRAEATVDLPRWRLTLDGEFSLADHPNAPLAGIALTGPIDDPGREVRNRELRAYVVRKLLGGDGGGDVNKVARKTGPKTGMDASATEAALDALGGVIAPRAAPVEALAESAKSAPSTGPEPDPRFNNVLKGIIKDLDN